jgi:hypothetical protein
MIHANGDSGCSSIAFRLAALVREPLRRRARDVLLKARGDRVAVAVVDAVVAHGLILLRVVCLTQRPCKYVVCGASRWWFPGIVAVRIRVVW